MIQVLICDNNPIFADYLRQEILTLLPSPSEISVCYSAEDLRYQCRNELPHIALLDIHLNDTPENGIALARELFPAGCGTSVIFITGYIEYVSEVYEADHIYFLRKPIKKDYLRKALDKALNLQSAGSTVFKVHIKGTTQLIDRRDILCIESFYRKLHFRMWNESVECYGSLSSLPDLVKDHMIACHKSFLVNPDYIRTMDRQRFLLKDGTSVPISRSRYVDSRKAFLDYCARHLKT